MKSIPQTPAAVNIILNKVLQMHVWNLGMGQGSCQWMFRFFGISWHTIIFKLNTLYASFRFAINYSVIRLNRGFDQIVLCFWGDWWPFQVQCVWYVVSAVLVHLQLKFLRKEKTKILFYVCLVFINQSFIFLFHHSVTNCM